MHCIINVLTYNVALPAPPIFYATQTWAGEADTWPFLLLHMSRRESLKRKRINSEWRGEDGMTY
jgi:hypothetical protein